jgi:hypothetical protein
MARWDDKTITRRSDAAHLQRAKVLPYIRACLAMFAPWRLDGNTGAAAFEALFDSTGPTSLQRAANKLQRELTPAFQRWFELEAGPLVPEDQVEPVNRILEGSTKILHAALDASAFHTASQEAYGDLQIGTGALLALEGNDQTPVKWLSAPAWAVAFEDGPSGRAENVFWEKEFPAYILDSHWPGAQWSAKTRKEIGKGADTKIRVRQSSYYDPDLPGWRIAVQECGSYPVVWDSARDRTNPWIIFRYWTSPGDPWGRGPAMLALPNVRTANKIVEMILTAAAYQLAPPLMVSHDGVVNPDTMSLSPRALIRVARTGGPMGPSIAALPIGGNVDMGNLVLEDQRINIKRDLGDEQLPPPTGAVRSASEIVERTKNLAYDSGAAFGRLNHEFAPQVVARNIDLLDRRKVATINWADLRIDQLIMKVKLTGPLARTQNLEDVQTIVQFWELAKGIGGEEAFMHIANLSDGLPKLAKLMGVPLWAVNNPDTRAMLAKAAGQLAAHMLTGQGGGAAGTQATAAPGAGDFGL